MIILSHRIFLLDEVLYYMQPSFWSLRWLFSRCEIANFSIRYHNPEKYRQIHSLTDIFSLCRLISIHIPFTSETNKIIGKECLEIANGAIIVNTSRALVIDQIELERAIDSQRVLYYGADVFWEEPPNFNNPLVSQFINRENVAITPHMGWYSEESEKEVRRKAAEEIIRVIEGEKPINWINRRP